MAGLGVRSSGCGGICAWCRASTALISPATPEPASRWPMLGLTEPIRHGLVGGAAGAEHLGQRASASMGSPAGVPVPCAST